MSRIKVTLQYVFIVALTLLLVWYSLRGLKTAGDIDVAEYLSNTWNAANKYWLFAMAVVAFLSHLIRAVRWRMLMQSSGHAVRVSDSFLSLMVGYLVNLAVPRGGEVSRCYNLYKLNSTPVEVSFGTVIVERIVDVICLLFLIAVSFLIESDKLIEFISTLPIDFGGSYSKLVLLISIVLGTMLIGFIFVYFICRSDRLRSKLNKTWSGFREGLLSITKLKERKLFVVQSLGIWALYFLMSYAVLKAFPATSVLGLNAVLNLFAIGSIAMAAPLPGGTGSYHVLVPQSLVFLYDVPMADAVAFTFIFHGWQTVIMIAGGAVSLLITSYRIKKKR